MSTHIFEQAARILEIAIDATPTAIRAAYNKAKGIAEKPIHLIEMAYEVMITATADYRIQAVKAFYKETCFAKAITQIQETPEEQGVRVAHSRDADAVYRMTSSKDPVLASIGCLHVAFGHY